MQPQTQQHNLNLNLKPKIGLEIHGYLVTREKLFCDCKAEFKQIKDRGKKGSAVVPNENICPICTGMPGIKPMLPNLHAIQDIVKIALILNCKINSSFLWMRKHYDWPDLPKGFQNTVSGAGSIPIGVNGNFLGIHIRSVHLEEDPAKWDPASGLVDYNRSGSPLVEIVTEPDFSSATEVRAWLKQLLITLSYIKAVDSDAGIKADVNVSISRTHVIGKGMQTQEREEEGERVEIKNINSLKNIANAIEFEIKRQQGEIRAGKKITRETRAFLEEQQVTKTMRGKEQAEDYRFIPDPDLPVVEILQQLVASLKKTIPELPQTKVTKFIEKFKVKEKEALILARERELAEFFDVVVKKVKPELQQIAAEWTTRELLRVLNYNKKKLHQVQVKPEHFSELLELIAQKKLTPLAAKSLLNKFIPKSFSPSQILKKEAGRISDELKIKKICEEVLKKNKQAVADFKQGREEAFNFLVGKVMQETRGKAAPEVVRKVMEKLLS